MITMTCEGLSSIPYFDGLKFRGCPLCRIINDLERKTIKDILYELTLEYSVRIKFINSQGLCPYHAWLLLDIAKETGEKLGASMIYESVLKAYVDKIDKVIEGDETKCFICENVRGFEKYYIEIFSNCINQRGLQDYEKSEGTFCVKHFNSLINSPNFKLRKEFLKIQRDKLISLHKKLKSYIDKHDYRNEDPITEDEESAIDLTIEALKGYKTSLSFNTIIPEKRRKFSLK